jgi:hypothetical protein
LGLAGFKGLVVNPLGNITSKVEIGF